MPVFVEFSYADWILRYPEFVDVKEPLAKAYFAEASLYHVNDGSGPVTDENAQLALLNMLTAHIAALNNAHSALAGSPIVGAINSASEGSVSVSGTPLVAPGTSAWYVTTRYGAAYWVAMAAYRTMHYRRGPTRQFNPPFIRPYP